MTALASMLVAAMVAANPFAKPGLPAYLWNQPEPVGLPELLVTAAGETVASSAAFPKAGEARQEGSLSYHLRAGEHDLKLSDWNRYMDFFDRSLKK